MKLICINNKQWVEEYLDNVVFVVLGMVEFSEGDREFVKVLEEKYDVFRDRVLYMGFKDDMKGEWKRYVG